MAVRKPEGTDNLFVVDVDMENRSPEDIARDAAMQINALFDRLVKEQKEKNDQDTVGSIGKQPAEVSDCFDGERRDRS